jgi:exodeoxyribonuclease V gamma subunit
MLRLVFSNRLDELAAQFDEDCSRHLAESGGTNAVFARTALIVDGLGIGQWLKYYIAERQRIASNIDTLYPAQFIWRLVEQALPGVAAASPVPGECLRWYIFEWLGTQGPLHAELTTLCAQPLARWQLAGRLAQLLGDYLVYRPQWLASWARGRMPALLSTHPHAAWQMSLWQWLAQQLGLAEGKHPFDLFFAAPATLALPSRVAVFGLSAIPPLYAEFLSRLAGRVQVDWYALSPSAEYFGDALSRRQAQRVQSVAQAAEGDTDLAIDEFIDELTGHPLLAASGRQMRDLQWTLAELAATGTDVQRFARPQGTSALAQVQRSVLDLDAQPALKLRDGDMSIRVHGCHTLLRQVEVLHDEILRAFAQDPALKPHEVAVLACDIDAAAPLVQAVFGSAPAEHAFAYRVTGVAPRAHAALDEAWLSLLHYEHTALARLESAAVLALLQHGCIARAARIDEEELTQVRRWCSDLQIAGGFAAQGTHDDGRHTWSYGFARLLIGIAQPAAEAALCTGVLPYAEAEGLDWQTAGKLIAFVTRLHRWQQQLTHTRHMAAWQALLLEGLEQFFVDVDDEVSRDWLLAARQAAGELTAHLPATQRDEAIPLAIVRSLIQERLRTNVSAALPSGSVTVTGLGELRGVPFKAVFVLGLEEAAFPSREVRREFDLLRALPQKGDRSRQSHERASLLDALLTASDRFAVFYNGRDAQSNEVIAPAIPVAELLGFLCSASGQPIERWLLQHPLHPFSPRAFQGPHASFDVQNLQAAQQIIQRQQSYSYHDTRISNMPLLDDESQKRGGTYKSILNEEGVGVDGEKLATLLGGPAEYFFSQRLKIRWDYDDEPLTEAEPSSLQGLEAWQLQSRLLPLLQADAAQEQIDAIAWAGSELPPAGAGTIALRKAKDAALTYSKLLTHTGVAQAQLREVSAEVAGQRIGLRIPFVRGVAVGHAMRSLKLRDIAWLTVVQALRALDDEAEQGTAVWLGKDGVLTLDALDADTAQALLSTWLDAAARAEQQPLALPAKTAYEFVIASTPGKLAAARTRTPMGLAIEAWQKSEAASPLWQTLLGGEQSEPPEGWSALVTQLYASVWPLLTLHSASGWLEAGAAKAGSKGKAK